jgi:hypothetical protein
MANDIVVKRFTEDLAGAADRHTTANRSYGSRASRVKKAGVVEREDVAAPIG